MSVIREPWIETTHFGKPMPLSSVLFALAAQEGNDYDEGNAMQAAAEFIRSVCGPIRERAAFDLPRPISVNTAYANNVGNGRGRYKTKAYKTWQAEAKTELMAQRSGVSVPLAPVQLPMACR